MNILFQFKNFFRKGQNNAIKVISLGIGLTIGLLLVAAVSFQLSYDSFYPAAHRVYLIQSNYSKADNTHQSFSQSPGGVAPGMKAEIPEVESATRYTFFADGTFFDDNRNKYSSKGFILADTCLFDVLPRPMLAGNAKQTLSRPMHALIAKSIAEKMGGIEAAMGQIIEIDSRPGKKIAIGGVFDDIPGNSHMDYDVIVSLSSIGEFAWDGSNNWLGNDRYMGYVKLRHSVDPKTLAPAFRKMMEKNVPMDELRKAGVDITYSLLPLRDIQSGTPESKRMIGLLSLLAFVILFTAVMNYILVVISQLIKRSKEIAIYKCYGASRTNIHARIFSETFVHLLFSLALTAIILFILRNRVSDLLGVSMEALFSLRGCLVMGGVCALVFVVSALIPAQLFSRIPIASVFRSYSEHRRKWKLALLFIQFAAAGFLLMLVVIIGRQYSQMVNSATGYEYKNLSYCNLSGVNAELRRTIITEIERMPAVEAVSTASATLLGNASGNNVQLPGDPRDLFNIADLYWVGSGYFDLMEIPVIEGRTFTEDLTQSNEVMVSRSFLEKMKPFADWSDGAIGKQILISEHSQNANHFFTVCGVYEDVRLGAIGREDMRPSVMFYNNAPAYILLVKYKNISAENDRHVAQLLKQIAPQKDIEVYPFASELKALYANSERFRNAVLVGGIIALILSLIGLTGYTNNEMHRRRKEIAIRKITGATAGNILALFVRDITRIAIVAMLVAIAVSAYMATKWLEQFSQKTSLSPVIFILCSMAVLAVVLTVVALNCYRAVNANPAEAVKTE